MYNIINNKLSNYKLLNQILHFYEQNVMLAIVRYLFANSKIQQILNKLLIHIVGCSNIKTVVRTYDNS